MPVINTLTKENLTNINVQILRAMKSIEEEFGITLKYKAGHYGESGGDLKYEISVNKTSTGISTEQAEFNSKAFLYGMTKTDYLKTFTYSGIQYTIYGINPRAHKMPIMARGSDGNNYKFSAETIKKFA